MNKILKIVVVLLFVAAIVFGGYKGYMVNKAVKKANAEAVLSFADMNAAKMSQYIQTSDDNIKNILLVGSDKRGSETGYGRADGIVIASIDKKNNALKVTSLVGDMYVQIPGHGENKLSMAYSFGGVSLLYETIASNFGIRLDNYAVMEFNSFVTAIDEVEGVPVMVSEFEANYLQKNYKTSANQVAIGENILNGTQALAYVRIKQDAAGDFGRSARQRKVIEGLYSKLIGTSVEKLVGIAGNMMKQTRTDMDLNTMKEYLASVVVISSDNLKEKVVPADNEYSATAIDGNTVYVINAEACKASIADFIYNPVDKEKIQETETTEK